MQVAEQEQEADTQDSQGHVDDCGKGTATEAHLQGLVVVGTGSGSDAQVGANTDPDASIARNGGAGGTDEETDHSDKGHASRAEVVVQRRVGGQLADGIDAEQADRAEESKLENRAVLRHEKAFGAFLDGVCDFLHCAGAGGLRQNLSKEPHAENDEEKRDAEAGEGHQAGGGVAHKNAEEQDGCGHAQGNRDFDGGERVML